MSHRRSQESHPAREGETEEDCEKKNSYQAILSERQFPPKPLRHTRDCRFLAIAAERVTKHEGHKTQKGNQEDHQVTVTAGYPVGQTRSEPNHEKTRDPEIPYRLSPQVPRLGAEQLGESGDENQPAACTVKNPGRPEGGWPEETCKVKRPTETPGCRADQSHPTQSPFLNEDAKEKLGEKVRQEVNADRPADSLGSPTDIRQIAGKQQEHPDAQVEAGRNPQIRGETTPSILCRRRIGISIRFAHGLFGKNRDVICWSSTL